MFPYERLIETLRAFAVVPTHIDPGFATLTEARVLAELIAQRLER